jgi:hypothetical protein
MSLAGAADASLTVAAHASSVELQTRLSLLAADASVAEAADASLTGSAGTALAGQHTRHCRSLDLNTRHLLDLRTCLSVAVQPRHLAGAAAASLAGAAYVSLAGAADASLAVYIKFVPCCTMYIKGP